MRVESLFEFSRHFVFVMICQSSLHSTADFYQNSPLCKQKQTILPFKSHLNFWFWHFLSTFVELTITYLVTLFDRKLQFSQKLAKLNILAFSNRMTMFCLSVHVLSFRQMADHPKVRFLKEYNTVWQNISALLDAKIDISNFERGTLSPPLLLRYFLNVTNAHCTHSLKISFLHNIGTIFAWRKKYMFYGHSHSVWKSQKKSYSILRAKRATFTFWVDKS